MKFLKLQSVILALLLSQSVFSQEKLFRPGYIITLENDTVFGELRYTSGQRDNKVCLFRHSKNQPEIKYSPAEISGYRFAEGKFFISKTVPVYQDTLSLFVEYLMKGRASFYYLVHNETEHYYIETPGHLAELTEKDTVIAVNGTEFWDQKDKYGDVRSIPYQAQPRYYGKLRYLLSDCPEIQPRVESVRMDHKSLINLGQEYHRLVCDNGECIVFERSVRPIKISTGLVAGFSVSEIRMGNSIDKMVPGYFAGLTTELRYLAENRERISFRIDALLQYSKTLNLYHLDDDTRPVIIKYNGLNYYILLEDDGNPTDTYVKHLDADVNLLALKVPVLLNYSFGSESNWTFITSLGASATFTISYNKNFVYQDIIEKYGKSFPGTMVGGVIGFSSQYKTAKANEIFAGISGEFNTSMAVGYERCGAKTINLQVGMRF